MDVLVCIKRVPATGARIALTDDGRHIDTKYLGFTVSPHEECAVEEAVRQIETHGGTSVALTLGPEAAIEQLQDALAIGIERAILLETDADDWDASATAAAIHHTPSARKRRRGRRSTSCSSATRLPTPATSRSASASLTR